MIQTHTSNTKRIAKNTIFLYLRSILIMIINLYASRIILSTLGINNYGIYNVVGGFVAMFSMLSSTFSIATQRFLSYEIGLDKKNKIKEIFSASLNIHLLLALSVFFLVEIFGFWFLNYKMNIPADRLNAANWVLHFSMIAFVVNLICIPYNAAIISYEKMEIFAYISILEASLKLCSLYFLRIITLDKLITYSFLVMSISIFISIIYGIYCKINFKECNYTKVKNKSFYRRFLNLSGWNFLGSSASIFTVQGVDLLLNLLGGGVAINAAKGIATQIQNTVTQLINNFMISLNPQITKSYASNDHKYLLSLINKGSRFSFFLLSIITLPIIVETNFILKLWLNNVPEYTTIFVRLALIYLMIHPFSTILNATLLATGKIKYSQIILSILQLLNFPISYTLLKLDYPPYSIYLSFILISIMSLLIRITFTKKYIDFSYNFYYVKIFLKSIIIIPFTLIIPALIMHYASENFYRLFIVSTIIEITLIISIYFVGLTKSEKLYFKAKLNKFKTNAYKTQSQ